MKTSITDNTPYSLFCYQASRDNKLFKDFRRSDVYRVVLEHVSKPIGQKFLDVIWRDSLLSYDELQYLSNINDAVGDPFIKQYIYSEKKLIVSPSTLRYLKVLSDIVKLFGKSDIKKIAEIGVGYGGQCSVIMNYMSIEEYTLFDLPEVLDLAERYLTAIGKDSSIKYIDGRHIYVEDSYDLVISNYAFSELYRSVQDYYLDKVILKSKRGYITWNRLGNERLDGYSVDELLEIIPGSKVIPEEPLTAPKNCIIVF